MAEATASQSPNDGTYAGALRSVQDREYFDTPAFHEKQGEAALTRGQAHPKLAEFVRLFVRRMRALNVPMFAQVYWDDMTVEIIHCRYGWNMPEKAWKVVGHVGQDVAARIRPEIAREDGKVVGRVDYNFEWGGDMTRYAPSLWKMHLTASGVCDSR